MLDMAAKIDATADYICKAKWGDIEFPPPFGREAYPEVRFYIPVLKNHICASDNKYTSHSLCLYMVPLTCIHSHWLESSTQLMMTLVQIYLPYHFVCPLA